MAKGTTNKAKTKLPEKKAVRNYTRWHYLIILGFAFILYVNTVPNHYSLDDNLVVLDNKVVMKGVESIPEILTSHYRADERNEYGYRPIAQITFAIESQFFTQNPHVSHFINMLLYMVLLILLFKILLRIFPDIPESFKLVIILLFAAHPLHTEVVASLKNREELLSFIFAAASLLFFIKAISDQKKRRIIMALSGAICLVLSVMSKQTGMLFCIIIPMALFQFYLKPFNFFRILNPENKSRQWLYIMLFVISVFIGVLFLYLSIKTIAASILFFLILPVVLLRKYIKNYKSGKNIIAENKTTLWSYVYLALFAIVIIVLGYASYKVPDVMLPTENKILNGFENPLFVDYSLYNRIALGFMGLLYYIKLLVIPYPLSFYYGYDMIPLTSIADFRVIFSIVIYALLLFFGIYLFFKNKILSFGILFFLTGLLMFANWFTIIPGIIGERLVFVASFGFCVAVVGGLYSVLNRLVKQGKLKAGNVSKTLYFIASLILVVYSVETISRNTDWKDHETLYKADITHLENSAKANSLYADEIMRLEYAKHKKNKTIDKSKIDIALKHYLLTLEVDSVYPSAYNNLGTIYFNFYQDYPLALSSLEKALKLDSLSMETLYNLAILYGITGDTANALKYYRKVAQNDPSFLNEITATWSRMKYKTEDEMKCYVDLNIKTSEIYSQADGPFINLGNYYISLGDTSTAVTYWEKAIAAAPVNNKLNTFLAEYFKKKGDMEKYTLYSGKISPE
jgi:hypothetical protein